MIPCIPKDDCIQEVNMSLSTQNSAGAQTKRVAQVKSQSIVEIRFSGREAGEIVAVYPQVSLTSCEAGDGRVTYGGRLICTVVYADEDGKLCRIQKGAEFSHFADDSSIVPAANVLCTLSCEKTQVKRDGSSYLLASVIGAEISVYATSERTFLTSAEGAVTLTESKKLYSAVTFSGESEVEDDFDCNAEDVLIPAVSVLVTDCNVRAGMAEIKGEIYLSVLAVREGKPVCFDRIVPFKSEITCEDALLARKAVCHAEVKEVSVEARVDEERGKCGVDAVIGLTFSGVYYDEEETQLVLDAFSTENELNLNFCEESASPCTEIKVFTERVSGPCATKAKLDYGCALLAAATPKAEFVRSENGLEGSVSATLLYEQNGEIHSTEVNLPFATELHGVQCLSGEIGVAVCGVNIRQRAEGECEAEAVLKISVFDSETCSVRYVTEITEAEKLKLSGSAISVFIPAEGDDLWSMAKKLLQSPDEIKATNPELTFPLTGNERILVFRGKSQ